ncbi:MAG: 3'-5' exonuclease, partial [Candidatus Contubernalis sp.]|nr:3'-5' exonuclease [Candidatus Contubernalis sp.]
MKEKILEFDGEVLYMTTNFRSLPRLIDWTNQAFEKEFSIDSAPYQTDFKPMDKFSALGQDSGVFKMPVETIKNNQEIIAQTDASKIAHWIYQSLDGNLKLARTPEELEAGLREKPVPGDFLILLRYKSNMAFYGRALEKYGIPFSLSGGSSISNSLELNELIYVLSTIVDPHNPIPLVTVLRGLFFGISDQQLYLFKEAGGRLNFMTSVPTHLKQDVFNLLNDAFDALKRFYRWSKELPPSSAIEKIVKELGIIPFALSQDFGKG